MDVTRFNPTGRFSNRVENYVKYRPGYPDEVMTALRKNCRLTKQSIVADIGSGTGILTRMFLKNGNTVYAVEPNDEMRGSSIALFKDEPRFHPVKATAESTGLAEDSIDLIAAGQAFHWFEPKKAKKEFLRILRPGGHIVLIWNDRVTDSTAFLREYQELLLRYCPEYKEIDHKNLTDERLSEFFNPYQMGLITFPNAQDLDLEQLTGRLLSASYAPLQDDPSCAPMLKDLTELFENTKTEGKVRFEYITKVYYCRVDGSLK